MSKHCEECGEMFQQNEITYYIEYTNLVPNPATIRPLHASCARSLADWLESIECTDIVTSEERSPAYDWNIDDAMFFLAGTGCLTISGMTDVILARAGKTSIHVDEWMYFNSEFDDETMSIVKAGRMT